MCFLLVPKIFAHMLITYFPNDVYLEGFLLNVLEVVQCFVSQGFSRDPPARREPKFPGAQRREKKRREDERREAKRREAKRRAEKRRGEKRRGEKIRDDSR